MLHRSYSFFSFIRYNVHSSRQEQVYLLHVALQKRHTSTFIKQQFIYVISNTSKFCSNNYNSRQLITVIKRFISNDSKSKNEKVEKADINKKENSEIKQKIVELDEEKLGKIKERLLNIESIDSITNNIKNTCMKLSKKDKIKADEKKLSIEELAVKKCIAF
jgi:hypothetical protein